MAINSIQYQLAESIKTNFKDSVVKKIDKDNFLDIYIPSVNNSKGTHLFFNTAKGQIKLGFYVRDVEFIDKVLAQSSDKIESYSQGIRLKSNPYFNTVEDGVKAAKDLLNYIDLTIRIPKTKSKVSIPKKKVISTPKKLKSDVKSESDNIKKNSSNNNLNTVTQNKSESNWLISLMDFFSNLFSK